MTTHSYPPSESGYWRVRLACPVEAGGFRYLPSFDDITVDETTLIEMLDQNAVALIGGATPDQPGEPVEPETPVLQPEPEPETPPTEGEPAGDDTPPADAGDA